MINLAVSDEIRNANVSNTLVSASVQIESEARGPKLVICELWRA